MTDDRRGFCRSQGSKLWSFGKAVWIPVLIVYSNYILVNLAFSEFFFNCWVPTKIGNCALSRVYFTIGYRPARPAQMKRREGVCIITGITQP